MKIKYLFEYLFAFFLLFASFQVFADVNIHHAKNKLVGNYELRFIGPEYGPTIYKFRIDANQNVVLESQQDSTKKNTRTIEAKLYLDQTKNSVGPSSLPRARIVFSTHSDEYTKEQQVDLSFTQHAQKSALLVFADLTESVNSGPDSSALIYRLKGSELLKQEDSGGFKLLARLQNAQAEIYNGNDTSPAKDEKTVNGKQDN